MGNTGKKDALFHFIATLIVALTEWQSDSLRDHKNHFIHKMGVLWVSALQIAPLSRGLLRAQQMGTGVWKHLFTLSPFVSPEPTEDKGFHIIMLSAYQDHVISGKGQKLGVVLINIIKIVSRCENVLTK